MPAKPAPRPLVSDALPLVIQAAFQHPVPAERAKIHAWLTTWIESLEPRFDADRIRDVLLEARGTEVEPFTLSPRDLEIAVLATRAAFSARVGHTRFRIVSSETIGVHGGLVLTSNLKSYYVERVSWGHRRVTPWQTSFVAPAALPPAPDGRGTFIKAASRLTSGGWQCDVPAECWGEGAGRADQVSIAAIKGTGARPLTGRDIAIFEQRGAVHLQTTGPESLMRLTMMAEERVPLALSSTRVSAVTRVIVRLAPFEEKESALPVLLTQTSLSTRQWAGFWADVKLPLPARYREAIARVFPMHDTWVTPALIGRLS